MYILLLFFRSRAKRDAKLGANQDGRIKTISDEEHRNRMDLLKPTPMDTSRFYVKKKKKYHI